jgi:putative FmdB family regulatory protein
MFWGRTFYRRPAQSQEVGVLVRLELCSGACTLARRRFIMPTYEYHCTKCDQNFEAFQSMRDESFRECPKERCRLEKWGHGKVKRLLGTGAGIIFKGSGFYVTDYRSNSYKEAEKKEAPVTSSTEKAAPTKEPAKTAAATPAGNSNNKSKKPATHDD